MYDLLIKNCVLNGAVTDIAVSNGVISAIGKIDDAAAEIFDAILVRSRSSACAVKTHNQ